MANVDLITNPIAENAKDLRKHSVVCDITFQAYGGSADPHSYIGNVINNIVSNGCGIDVCGVDDGCDYVTDGCDLNEDADCTIDGYKVSQQSSYGWGELTISVDALD